MTFYCDLPTDSASVTVLTLLMLNIINIISFNISSFNIINVFEMFLCSWLDAD